MIRIAYKLTDKEFVLQAKGHAGTAEKGRDIVCAGVSALVLTFAQVCTGYEAVHQDAGGSFNIQLDDGRAYIKAEKPSAYIRVAAQTVLTGLYMLADKYSENIKVIRD